MGSGVCQATWPSKRRTEPWTCCNGSLLWLIFACNKPSLLNSSCKVFHGNAAKSNSGHWPWVMQHFTEPDMFVYLLWRHKEITKYKLIMSFISPDINMISRYEKCSTDRDKLYLTITLWKDSNYVVTMFHMWLQQRPIHVTIISSWFHYVKISWQLTAQVWT